MRKKSYLSFGLLALFLCGMVVVILASVRQNRREFRLKEKKDGRLTYYYAEHTEQKYEPVMILCHGLGGNHADMRQAAETFYNMGYAVVTFDLYGHEGNVYDSDIYLNEMIEGSKNKLEWVLGALQKEKVCNVEDFGVYGTSLGGVVAFYLGAYGEAVPKVIISVASSPDIEDVFKNSLYYIRTKWSFSEERFVYSTPEEQSALVDWASAHNPMDKLENFIKIPIIMVNGTEDQYMSIEQVRSFKKNIEEKGGNIKVYENENGKHDDLGDYHFKEILLDLESSFWSFAK